MAHSKPLLVAGCACILTASVVSLVVYRSTRANGVGISAGSPSTTVERTSDFDDRGPVRERTEYLDGRLVIEPPDAEDKPAATARQANESASRILPFDVDAPPAIYLGRTTVSDYGPIDKDTGQAMPAIAQRLTYLLIYRAVNVPLRGGNITERTVDQEESADKKAVPSDIFVVVDSQSGEPLIAKTTPRLH
jgi:hypothetical protein